MFIFVLSSAMEYMFHACMVTDSQLPIVFWAVVNYGHRTCTFHQILAKYLTPFLHEFAYLYQSYESLSLHTIYSVYYLFVRFVLGNLDNEDYELLNGRKAMNCSFFWFTGPFVGFRTTQLSIDIY
jgi:hypothetical protein